MPDKYPLGRCRIEGAAFLDCGRMIGVSVEMDGLRRAVKVANPFWPEIDAEWRESHPDFEDA